jgi:hypothetical protein
MRAFRNLVIFSVLVSATSVAAWALSVVNSKTFSLSVVSGKLVVNKGRLMPWGVEPFAPDDPVLAETYGPLDLEGNTALAVVGVRFADRDELDRAFFQVLELIAKPRVGSDKPGDVAQALAVLRRAEKLRGLSDEQRKSLKHMQGEVAFGLAMVRLDEARRLLDEGIAQLKLASDTDTRHAKAATEVLLKVEPQLKSMSDDLRAATHGLLSTGGPLPFAATVGQGRGTFIRDGNLEDEKLYQQKIKDADAREDAELKAKQAADEKAAVDKVKTLPPADDDETDPGAGNPEVWNDKKLNQRTATPDPKAPVDADRVLRKSK